MSFDLAVCSEMVFTELDIVERAKRIDDLGFQVEIWSFHDKDLDALAATGGKIARRFPIVGGIDASTNTWWRNQYYDFSDASVTASSTTITHAMNLVYLRCTRGTDVPKIVLAGENYFTFYEESLQAQQRFMNEKEGAGGFMGYRYKGADSSAAITRVTVKGDLIKVRGGKSNWAYTLNEPSQGKVAVRLRLGTSATWCADVLGKPGSNNDVVDRFTGQPKMPPPVACPAVP